MWVFGPGPTLSGRREAELVGKVGADRGQTPPLVGKLSSSLPERLFGGEQSGNGPRSLENEVSEVSLFGDVGDGSGSGASSREPEGCFLRREARTVTGETTGKNGETLPLTGELWSARPGRLNAGKGSGNGCRNAENESPAGLSEDRRRSRPRSEK